MQRPLRLRSRRAATSWLLATSLAASPLLRAAPSRAADAAPAAPSAELSPRERADAHLREAATAGQAGDWDAAISAFRKAEALFPRAIHDCNIGLSFMRSGRPHMAWTYLGRCQVRATDALPPWVDTMRRDALTQMRSGAFAPVEITATPPSLYVSVDALPDETFVPTASPGAALGTLVLWLPHGAHTLRFGAPDHVPDVRSLDVEGRETTRLSVALARTPAPQVSTPERVPAGTKASPSDVLGGGTARPGGGVSDATIVGLDAPPASASSGPDRSPSLTSWLVLGTGVALLGSGLVARAAAADTAAEPTRLRIPETDPRFDDITARYELQNTLWIALALTGGIMTAAGATLMGVDLWGPDPGDSAASSQGHLLLAPLRDGGAVTLLGRF
jgi:hypothetical protein